MTKQLQLLPRLVLSLVRDILELNYCTKLFHQTVHASSARLCKTRRNIGVLRGKHHSKQNRIFCRIFCRVFRIFQHFLPIPATTFPPPPCAMPHFTGPPQHARIAVRRPVDAPSGLSRLSASRRGPEQTASPAVTGCLPKPKPKPGHCLVAG